MNTTNNSSEEEEDTADTDTIPSNTNISVIPSIFPISSHRRIIQGNCGWSDQSLVSCQRFFPPKLSSSIDKLSYFSRCGLFGCIEIDSTTYHIPSPQTVQTWVDATPPEFIFHLKAFGMLCSGGIEMNKLPVSFRSQYIDESKIINKNQWVSLESLGENGQLDLWNRFNTVVEPVKRCKKLGFVLFQFHSNFCPSMKSLAYLRYCASSLLSDYPMAVDFRNRTWVNETNLSNTINFLKELRPEGVVLTASDDLIQEMNLRDVSSIAVDQRNRLPIVLTSRASNLAVYIRVHRREGCHRILSHDEILEWVDRINVVLNEKNKGGDHTLIGPIFFLWATDHEDQPVINARHLSTNMPHDNMLDYEKIVSTSQSHTTPTIKDMFRKQLSRSSTGSSTNSSGKADNKELKTSTSSSHLGKRSSSSMAMTNKSTSTSNDKSPKKLTIKSYFTAVTSTPKESITDIDK